MTKILAKIGKFVEENHVTPMVSYLHALLEVN